MSISKFSTQVLILSLSFLSIVASAALTPSETSIHLYVKLNQLKPFGQKVLISQTKPFLKKCIHLTEKLSHKEKTIQAICDANTPTMNQCMYGAYALKNELLGMRNILAHPHSDGAKYMAPETLGMVYFYLHNYLNLKVNVASNPKA